MKKLAIYFLTIPIFVIASFVLEPWQSHSTTVFAATSTPSAGTPTATPSESPDIQERIKTLVKENLSATESNLKEKINLQTLVGFVGTIKSINTGNITIDSKEGSLIQITTNDKTEFNKSGAASKLSALALSDKIIIIGTMVKDDIILAKRIIVVVDEPNPIISGTVVAKISAIDLKKKTISLNINNKEVIFGLTKKSTIKLEELKVGQNLFAITKKFAGKDLLSRAKVI